ncbi:MAG: gluconate 2-dehydrogenase subunit 3 family protein [Actinobacteria bacterium]|nr:gluconate 2-dehydrogenase subunit 3 family protein [Actinomycetota bacterium]
MPRFLTDSEHRTLAAACDRLIPPLDAHPGAAALGVADYVDTLLAAFTFDPPRIFAGGPYSGRAGGDASFDDFLALSPLEELAWRTRIEGSRGEPAREFNGPVVGWQQRYRDGLGGLGADFADQPPGEQDRRLDADPAFKALCYEHACEGAYGAPEYGGNRGLAGWTAIHFAGDVQPRGYTDEAVSGRD